MKRSNSEGNIHTTILTVPWRNKAEFIDVRNNLFSNNIEKMEWALERVAVWKCKARCNVIMKPIEVTDKIIQARLLDMKQQLEPQQVSKYELDEQLSTYYGMALIRFMALAAELPGDYDQMLGLPLWVVQIRNDLSHQLQPSLLMLRNACAVALKWIEAHFWVVKEKAMMDFVPKVILPLKVQFSEESSEKEIWNILSSFQDLQFKIRYGRAYNSPRRNEIRTSFKKMLKKIKLFLFSEPKIFISILAKPGFLVLRYDNLDAILPKEETNFLEGDSINLPRALENFWKPVVTLFNASTFLQSLLEVLITQNAEEDSLSQRVATAWFYRIIKMISMNDNTIFEFLPQLDWFRLLDVALKMPNVYSPILLTHIFLELNIEEIYEHTLMALVAIKLGSTVDSTIKKKSGSKIFKVEDLREVFDKTLKKKSKKSEKGAWSIADSSLPWHEIPIGEISDSQFYNSDSDREDKSTIFMDKFESYDKSTTENNYEMDINSQPIEIKSDNEETSAKSKTSLKRPGSLETMQLIVF